MLILSNLEDLNYTRIVDFVEKRADMGILHVFIF